MKKPSPPARVLVGLGVALLALIPATPPPGAGNAYEYALETELNRAKNTEEGYVYEAQVFSGHLHAATIGPDGDGDAAVVAAVEEAQRVAP